MTFSSESTELWARMRKPGSSWGGASGFEAGSVPDGQWLPLVDIVEESDCFRVRADLPGVGSERIEVVLTDGVLSIRGARASSICEQGTGYHHIERAGGAFHRRFALPDSADPARIHAFSRDGVLEIEILKRPAALPTQEPDC